MNKLELKAKAYDIVLTINKKQVEIQSLQQQLNEVNKQLMEAEKEQAEPKPDGD
jgi:hypothetical protein